MPRRGPRWWRPGGVISIVVLVILLLGSPLGSLIGAPLAPSLGPTAPRPVTAPGPSGDAPIGYDNVSVTLPAWNNLSGYASNCDFGGTNCRTYLGVLGTQQPILSWTSDGIYYVNASLDLVYYSLANRTVRLITSDWIPLYDNVMEYQGIENTEFITSDGSYIFEFGCLEYCDPSSSITVLAANVTTGQTFLYTFDDVDVSMTESNAQVNMVGIDGNDSILTLIDDHGAVFAYDIWTGAHWILATFSYFEANNVYWVPELSSFLDVTADGSSVDQISQWRLSGPPAHPTLSVVASLQYLPAGSMISNGVNGLYMNLSAREISVTEQATFGSPAVYATETFSLNPQLVLNATVSSSGVVAEVNGTWPYPSVRSDEHRATLSTGTPAYDTGYNSANGSFLSNPANGHFVPSSASPFALASSASPGSDDTQDFTLAGLFMNSSYWIAPSSLDCRSVPDRCPIRGSGQGATAPGTIWYDWRSGLPEFPFSPRSALAETLPPAPVTASATLEGTTATIHWNPPASGTDPLINYTLFWGATPTQLTQHLPLPSTTTSHSIVGLPVGSTIFFAVEAWNLHWHSAPANIGSAAIPPVLSPPHDVAVTAVNETSVTIHWTNAATDATKSVVYWGPTCGTLVDERPLPANATGTVVSGLRPGGLYCFAVAAGNASTLSPLSRAVRQATLDLPAAPTGLHVLDRTGESIRLGWDDPPGRMINATIYWGTSCEGLDRSESTQGPALEATVGGLAVNTTYCFAVEVWNTSGPSPWSGTVVERTAGPPVPPSETRAGSVPVEARSSPIVRSLSSRRERYEPPPSGLRCVGARALDRQALDCFFGRQAGANVVRAAPVRSLPP